MKPDRSDPNSSRPGRPGSDVPESPAIDPATPLVRLGEWDALGGLLLRLPASEALVLGPGDDAAAQALPAGEVVVTSIDTLVERVHFQRHWSTPADLGYRLVAMAASDLAAMAAAPLGLLVAVSAPGALRYGEFLGLGDGIIEAARDFDLPLIGGDTTAAAQLVLTATVLGRARADVLARRDAVTTGERVLVTGKLGEAAAGLRVLQSVYGPAPPDDRVSTGWLAERSPLEWLAGDWPAAAWQAVVDGSAPPAARAAPAAPSAPGGDASRRAALQSSLFAAVRQFLRPGPLLEAAMTARALGATAMIDISDGLASELHHLAAASGVGFAIVGGQVPIGPGARAWAELHGRRPLELALGGGEDYQLLCTAPAAAVAGMIKGLAELGVELVEIGEAVPAAQGLTLIDAAGERQVLSRSGYEHFGSDSAADGLRP